jgi:hypothetical protein
VAHLAVLLVVTHHCPAVAVAARIGHAARKVVCAALRGAGGVVTETPFARAPVLHLAVRTISAKVAADNTRPLPITFERRMLMDHLAQAERHVAQGEAIIERQLSLVAELARDGHDTEEARALLTTFRQIQKLSEQDHARLKRELRELPLRST